MVFGSCGEISMGETRWNRSVRSFPGFPYSDCAPTQYCFSWPERSESREYCPLQEPYTVSGLVACGMIGPVSQPGPCIQLWIGSSGGPEAGGRLGTMSVEL